MLLHHSFGGGEWDWGKYSLFRRTVILWSSVNFPINPAGMYGVECIPDYSNPVLIVETLDGAPT